MKAFIAYVSFREQKKRGRRPQGTSLTFDVDQWTQIIDLFGLHAQNKLECPLMEALEPKNGVGWTTLNSTKAALRKMWLKQRDDGINTHAEDIMFGTKLSKVMPHVKQRKPRMDKKNFKEKMKNE